MDAEIAVSDDLAIGWGAALADSGMPPLWPWTRALRALPEPRAAIAAVVAGGVQGDFGTAEDATAATFATDTAVIDALEAHVAHGGTLLVLEDLQWADGASFRLLERVAAEIRRLRLLVIATHRDPAHVALRDLLARAGTEVVRLHPLSSQEAETLLATAVDGVDPAAARQAAARSGGSPLYLRTLAQVAGDQLRGQGSWAERLARQSSGTWYPRQCGRPARSPVQPWRRRVYWARRRRPGCWQDCSVRAGRIGGGGCGVAAARDTGGSDRDQCGAR